ncbi:transglycosylase SLT domain-containing protein [Pseudidiomarina sediminum]|uniref:transglycosylase SLT domain-containing protein n=1 Tax=Pseudidiomarina sediminum TaxID=431675 RepID=UPI001C98BEA8|nr:transglycosylase SLT domain-containing protein [Pseudidiomarina sediminum]MBY6064218.1 transglycosylase SLT domain-containing protein [Pseudidiomarina sediminum]
MRLLRSTACALLFTVLTTPISFAEPKLYDPVLAGDKQREQQRELFVKAEYAARRGRLLEYQQLLDQLDDYPLRPYLELERLQQVGYLANEDRVLAFLASFDDSPMAWQLRYPWLDYLAHKDEQKRFMRDFRFPGKTAHQCYYWRFALQQKSHPREAVMRAVDQLWLTGESLPKSCDPLLSAWTKAGQRSDELVWQRAKLAAEGGKHSLLRYLSTLVEEPTRSLILSYRQVRRNPANLVREMKTLGQQKGVAAERAASIVTYGLNRLIWRDPDTALATVAKLPKSIPLSAAQWTEIEQTFAVALSVKNHAKAHTWLVKLSPAEHTQSTLQWQLAEWVREGQWQAFIDDPVADMATASGDAQWRYWRGRAYEELNQPQRAQAQFEEIAHQRNYYGFLAATKLGQTPRLGARPINYSAQELAAVRQLAGVQRAYELLQLNRFVDARREWYQLLQSADGRQQELLAVLASQWEWHDQVIYTLGQLGEFDAIEQRFPLAYEKEHREFADAAGIDMEWAMAISRRESSFRFDAHSHAGAYGIMQLLPSTARYVGRRTYDHGDLKRVSTNIHLGTKYLADLKRRLGDNWVLATAAYNGGIYRVNDWIPEQAIAIDRWIETIPYKETRDYVKNVLAYQQIYLLVAQTNAENRFTDVVKMTVSKASVGL